MSIVMKYFIRSSVGSFAYGSCIYIFTGGHCNLVVKVVDSWLAYHKLESNAAEDPSCTGDQCMLNLSRFKYPLVGVVWKLGKGDAILGAYCHLTMDQITWSTANSRRAALQLK
ncbi:hypothetical protein TNCV_1173461 [Trichonephila clavipes]|uniref:Uncharacterized protein n=1 Tax=Trichonephila clavipes TaxID=2585209 RepID=A0A8X6S238_TRICX|nr:hypothetical protein TNCV_1173461 [Trichonephila clavipes]